jgi:hypothetical protein
MAHTPKPLRRRALREAPGIARRGLGVALTGRFLGAGATVAYQQDCGHEVLQIPATVHHTEKAQP